MPIWILVWIPVWISKLDTSLDTGPTMDLGIFKEMTGGDNVYARPAYEQRKSHNFLIYKGYTGNGSSYNLYQ